VARTKPNEDISIAAAATPMPTRLIAPGSLSSITATPTRPRTPPTTDRLRRLWPRSRAASVIITSGDPAMTTLAIDVGNSWAAT